MIILYKKRICGSILSVICLLMCICLFAGCSAGTNDPADKEGTMISAGDDDPASGSDIAGGGSNPADVADISGSAGTADDATKKSGEEGAGGQDTSPAAAEENGAAGTGGQNTSLAAIGGNGATGTGGQDTSPDAIGGNGATGTGGQDISTAGTGGEAGAAETGDSFTDGEAHGAAATEALPDTTPPVFKEYRSHLVYIGDTVSYRSGVILTDDSGEEPVLTIDSSSVNLKEPGEYPLIYTATDAAGNSATCEVSVVVREREDITQDMLDARADEIIAEVLGDAPRDIEALETLFKWTKKNIHYVNYFEQKDDISAAWEGLMYERGDCYVYACASKELLTRAGFKNDMIKTARHFWNLVDLGDGWYHYDTCPRKDKPYFFMWGDEQLMEYSKANGNSHDYDHTKWPSVMP